MYTYGGWVGGWVSMPFLHHLNQEQEEEEEDVRTLEAPHLSAFSRTLSKSSLYWPTLAQ